MKCLVAVMALCCQVASACGATLQGQVVNSNGIPIAGARVDISTAAPRIGPAMFCPSCYLDCAKSAKTDDTGHYRLEGLSDALKFRVLFTASGQKSQLMKFVDPLDGDLDVTMAPPVSGAAEQTIRGRVLDDTGHAVEGALVSPFGAKTSSKRWWGQVDDVEPTVCDEEGRFSMLLPADYQAVDIDVSADGKAGTALALLKPGGDEHKITIPAGTSVTGRLVYRGQPVAGLRIAVVQLARDSEHHFIGAVPATTDESGRFRFNFLPANERYAIYTLIGEGASESRDLVLGTKLFTARDNDATRDLGDLEAQPGLHIHGRIEPPQGQTLPPNAKLGIDRDPAWDLAAISIGSDGQFSIKGLPPETYELRIMAKGVEIDGANLHYQLLGPQSLGIHIDESVDGLRIPLVQR